MAKPYRKMTENTEKIARAMVEDRQRLFLIAYETVREDFPDWSDEEVRQVATGHMIALDRAHMGWSPLSLAAHFTTVDGDAPEDGQEPSGMDDLESLAEVLEEQEERTVETWVATVRKNPKAMHSAIRDLVPPAKEGEYKFKQAISGILSKVGKEVLGLDSIPVGADENSQDMRELLLRCSNAYMQLRAAGIESQQALENVQGKFAVGQV